MSPFFNIVVNTVQSFLNYLLEGHKDTIERVKEPIAVYSKDGTIIMAEKKFRELAGITEEDITLKKANLFDCLNSENEKILAGAREVFNGIRLSENYPVNPLRVMPEAAYGKSLEFVSVTFFPVSYAQNEVEYSAFYLSRKKDKEQADDG